MPAYKDKLKSDQVQAIAITSRPWPRRKPPRKLRRSSSHGRSEPRELLDDDPLVGPGPRVGGSMAGEADHAKARSGQPGEEPPRCRGRRDRVPRRGDDRRRREVLRARKRGWLAREKPHLLPHGRRRGRRLDTRVHELRESRQRRRIETLPRHEEPE